MPMVPQVQPVNAGETWSDGASSGPVNETTNVWFALPVFVEPTATHSDALTHDTDFSTSLLVPAFGLVTIDHTLPFHTIANVTFAEPVIV